MDGCWVVCGWVCGGDAAHAVGGRVGGTGGSQGCAACSPGVEQVNPLRLRQVEPHMEREGRGEGSVSMIRAGGGRS
jgi:hypothetical protein